MHLSFNTYLAKKLHQLLRPCPPNFIKARAFFNEILTIDVSMYNLLNHEKSQSLSSFALTVSFYINFLKENFPKQKNHCQRQRKNYGRLKWYYPLPNFGCLLLRKHFLTARKHFLTVRKHFLTLRKHLRKLS